MPTYEEKERWRKEKEQQLQDKQNQGRVVKKRKAKISFGNKKKKQQLSGQDKRFVDELPADDLLRKRLGI